MSVNLITLLTQWGVPLVFTAVLLEQAGLPVPAAAVLVLSGSLAAAGPMRPEVLLLGAVIAALVADHAWFLGGRRYGRRLLATICRVSLSPDTCVRRTDDLVSRHGPVMLLVAKFMPGVSVVMVPTLAAMGIRYRRFFFYDSLGCLIWSGAYIGAGMIFSHEIEELLTAMSWVGGGALAVFGALLAIYVAAKYLHRRRLRRLHRLVRIAPHEVLPLLGEDPDLVILDARSALARAEDPRTLPRSIVLEDRSAIDVLGHDSRGRLVVTFCTCPNEASAAFIADQLIRAGYSRVRVLTGGSEALSVLVAR